MENKAIKPYNNLDNKNSTGKKDSTNRYECYKDDHINYRYQILTTCGKGVFGSVIKVTDHKINVERVIKIIKDEPRFYKQAKKELNILNLINEKLPKEQTLIHLIDTFDLYNHKCFVFEKMYINLYEHMLKNTNGLPITTVNDYTLQLLYGLKFLESLDIIHADLKPENIMLKDPTAKKLVIIDFGSSFLTINKSRHFYMQSRYYRAPEIILGYHGYNNKIDLWSLACIVFEIATPNIVLFRGKVASAIIYQINKIIGSPNKSFIDKCHIRKEFDTYGNIKETVIGNNYKTSLDMIEDDKLNQFLKLVLVWDPEERCTITDCLVLLS